MEEFYNTELPVERRKELIEIINHRSIQLNDLDKFYFNGCINYLFYCNGGGVIACFGVINFSMTNEHLWWIRLCGAIFLIGLILVGFLKLVLFKHIDNMLLSWLANSKKFFEQKISFQDLNKKDEGLTFKQKSLLYFLGYSSLSAFVLSCVIGIYFSLK